MGLRLRKRTKIAPGVYINLSKSGVSTSIGGKGATVNLSKKGIRGTIGLPGSGLSYSSQMTKFQSESHSAENTKKSSLLSQFVKITLIIVTICWACGAFK